MPRLLILGAGGFGRCVAELALLSGRYDEVAFLDDHADAPEVLGTLSDYARTAVDFDGVFPAFGDNALRLSWVQRLGDAGFSVPVLVHPAAVLSPSARLGAGSVLMAGAIVCAGVSGGAAVLVNCNAVVDHDCTLGEGAHICIGALIKASCTLAPLLKIEAGQVVLRPL